MWLISLLAACWTLSTVTPPFTGHRAAPRACAPSRELTDRQSSDVELLRSDERFDYFRRQKELTVTLAKPIGAVMEEAEQGGVKVGEVMEGGSAAATGLVMAGDRIVSISGMDVSGSDFDTVRDATPLQLSREVQTRGAFEPCR